MLPIPIAHIGIQFRISPHENGVNDGGDGIKL